MAPDGDGEFIHEATDRMARKGTLGSFGKTTAKKVARAKKRGGKEKKKAIFAENMRKIARRRRRGGSRE